MTSLDAKPAGKLVMQKSSKALAMLDLDLNKQDSTAANSKELEAMKNEAVFIPAGLKDSESSNVEVPRLFDMHTPESKSDDNAMKPPSADENAVFQLVFNVKHCIFRAGDETILLFSIYDDTNKQFLTEEYCLQLSEKNFPKQGNPEDCQAMFRDLTLAQLKHDLFIICRIYRVGSMDAPDPSKPKKNKKSDHNKNGVIRPYAITVIRLKDHQKELLDNLGAEMNFEPGSAPIMCPNQEHIFSSLPFDLIAEKKTTAYVPPMSIGIAHSLTLYNGGMGTVKKVYKEFDKLTMVDTLDINPQTHSDRHLLYITILDVHVQQRGKRAPCNVQMKLQLRNNTSYQPLPGSVMMGKGAMASPQEEGSSPVYYHTNDPTYNQTFLVLAPTDIKQLEACHLYFSCWHTPATNKRPDERGFGFLPLFHPNLKQLTANNTYDLDLYRMDRKSGNYLDNPNLKPEGKSIRIHYQLCSTKVLPDIDIHTFLTWAHQTPESLIKSVKRVSRKPFNELLTILDDFMKAVFEIMLRSQEQMLIEQTFFALVGVFGEVNKGVNIKFKARIEEWIQKRFEYHGIWRTLGQQQLKLLRWIASPEAVKAENKDAHPDLKRQSAEITRQLTKTMRGVQYLFQLMKRSCELEIKQFPNNRTRISHEYNQQIRQLFESLNRLMGLSQPRTVNGVQSFALRGFLSLLDSLPNQSSQELLKTTVKFIKSTQITGVQNNVEKLLLIRRVLEHPRLERKHIVQIFLPCVGEQLRHHMNQSIDEQIATATILRICTPLLDPNRERIVFANVDAAAMSSSAATKLVADGKGVVPSPKLLDVFSALLLRMFEISDSARVTEMSEVTNAQRIFGKNLAKNPGMSGLDRERTFTVAEIDGVSDDQITIHRNFVVTVADLARVLTGSSGKAESFGKKSERVDKVLADIRATSEENAIHTIDKVLECCYNLLRNSVFPKPWVYMRAVEAEVAMRGLSWFGSTLKRNYLGRSFNKDLWNRWLGLGMAFLSQPDFALEEDDETMRSSIIRDSCGDLRSVAIKKISAAWDVLTPHRSDLAETMVSAAVETSASEVEEIQEFAVNVYFQMMKSEFESTKAMKTVETHTIDQVDELTAKYSTEEKIMNRYLDFFRINVADKLKNNGNARLQETGEQFLAEIEMLYGYFTQLKKLPSDGQHEDERTSATLKLLDYLDASKKTQLYNRYIHHLALMHQRLGNQVEAGNCFKQHASRLGWRDEVLRAEPQVGLDAAPEWKRHVQLLENAHRQYMLGEAWEMGVRVVQELAHVYESELFDLKALSASLEKQSQLWKFISQHDRVFHSSYLVSFRGNFPSVLKNEQYIFRSGRGKNPEPVRDFTERIRAKWKEAKIVNSSDEIPDEYESKDFDGQFIRVTTLQPSSEEELNGGEFHWDKNTKAPLRMKKYYREMETSHFHYTYQDKSKKKKGENEFRNLWITKVFVIAADVIPSMRRRIPVVKEHRITYTPLQTAINNLRQKTVELGKIVETCETDVSHNTNALSMNLNGILDAAVMGGVSKYREAFFDGDYMEQHPHERDIAMGFKEALQEQMQLAESGLDTYTKYCPESLAAHAEHLASCLVKMKRDLTEFIKQDF